MPRTASFPKYIFVSGGVLSGLGKGITTASIALLLKSRGFKVTCLKFENYLNIDAGTIRPQEHGEIFVCRDGFECDQDIGTYERFLNQNLSRENFVTIGQIYHKVIAGERAFAYEGEDVEAIPHITEEILKSAKKAAQKDRAQIILVELGGTAGEYQNVLYYEAYRILKNREPQNALHIHVTYVPIPSSIGEMKTKPTQMSVKVLNSMGIQPDFIVGRSSKPLDERSKKKIALFCGVDETCVISNPDVASIYEVPLILEDQDLDQKILEKLGLKPQKSDLKEWRQLVERINTTEPKLKIAIVGKYQKTGENSLLEDAYLCVIEALKHACWEQKSALEIHWFGAEALEDRTEKNQLAAELSTMDGIIVPQGWGSRGVEGKIEAVRIAREKKIPYLGLCFGMQMAVIEFARNVCGFAYANSTEVKPKTRCPVIHSMPGQEEYLNQHQYGGTIRLGAWPCRVKKGTVLDGIYQSNSISERHRHRYEVNNRYKKALESKGLIISGTSPDGKLVEAIELPTETHPFFLATQFHPEYQSRPLNPHPIFSAFVKAAANELQGLSP